LGKIRIALSAIALIGAIVFVMVTTELNSVALSAARIPMSALLEISAAIILGYMLASARVRAFAGYAGYPLRFRDAVAAVSAGQIAGNLFFQIVGQVMARSALFSRAGLPVATTVVITGYERLFALVVSLVLAGAGALSIFGIISVDAEAGGYDLAKLFVGGILALLGGALLGWGTLASGNMPKFERRHLGRLVVGLALSTAIQLTTMAAYVMIAHALSPEIPLLRLAAAASVVMLAASLPISLAGWGVREVSAVFALGAVGVAPGDSLISAVTIGVLSLVVAAILALLSFGAWKSAAPTSAPSSSGYDFSSALATWLPIFAATGVVFQVYLPAGSGKINVNFADPIAILAGVLFVIWLVRNAAWPKWRLPMVNAFLICFSAATLFALLNGYFQIGWTSWAFTNKAAGWLVLICYLLAGAMIIGVLGAKGFPVLLGTYVGSVTAVAALDLLLLFLRSAGVAIPEAVLGFRISGFAQNPNALGFQLLMAFAAIIVMDIDRYKKFGIGLILFAAIWFSGSRASFGKRSSRLLR
jgi:uncharacterized membrane protein YbhN (UPF0104 family)